MKRRRTVIAEVNTIILLTFDHNTEQRIFNKVPSCLRIC